MLSVEVLWQDSCCYVMKEHVFLHLVCIILIQYLKNSSMFLLLEKSYKRHGDA